MPDPTVPLRERMARLADTFPSLEGMPGLRPWNPAEFETAAFQLSSGGQHAARFILCAFNSYAKWELGTFDLFAALGVWDSEHRGAFQAWALDPWIG